MLKDGGTQNIQGSSYHMYNGSSLIAGSSLEFTLSGNPKKATASIFTTGNMQNLAIGLGAIWCCSGGWRFVVIPQQPEKALLTNVTRRYGLSRLTRSRQMHPRKTRTP